MDLTTFLLARYAEDEAAVEDARSAGIDEPIPADCWGPDRVLAECAAKRRIVDLAAQYAEPDDAFDPGFNGGANHVGYNTLRYLAAVYAEHPDYREEWRP